ncbi:MAG: hypothetical protein MJZ33_14705 [Paludibacteraceae bacterium]|nr:hypothetical protein [Paludibacteraceae bacterium]
MEESSAGWQSPYYFNSKELDEETGLYYYGARYLNPTEARWLSVDPMFEKYVGMSPYNYCAENPVKLVDVEGRDYSTNINEVDQTITISATYFTAIEDAKSAENAVDFWNSQTDKFIYQIKNKSDKSDTKDYTVKFDLKVEVVPHDGNSRSKKLALYSKLKGKRSEDVNVYMVVNDQKSEPNNNGKTIAGNIIQIKNSKKEGNTGIHEIGHTLGLGHFNSGVMTTSESEENRSSKIRPTYISNIVENSLHGGNTKNGNTVGKGVLTPNSKPINLKSYKVYIIQKER